MKKLLLLAASTAVLSTSAMAEGIYIRTDFGVNKLQDIIYNSSPKVEAKTKVHLSLDLGVGYNITDSVRAELTFGHHFNPKTRNFSDGQKRGGEITSKIETLMVKAYADIAEIGVAKIFFGAGLGVVKASNKMTSGQMHKKSKVKYNITTSVALGTAFKVAEGVNTDVQYNFSDYGNIKESFLRGHSVKVGLRFDI